MLLLLHLVLTSVEVRLWMVTHLLDLIQTWRPGQITSLMCVIHRAVTETMYCSFPYALSIVVPLSHHDLLVGVLEDALGRHLHLLLVLLAR